jgi:hypothetical protein
MFVNNEMNEEIVWAHRYESLLEANEWDASVRPECSAGNGQRPGPTLETVNAFGKADGTPYTELVIPEGSNLSPESTVAFWKNREPRFYAFIAYNGCVWPMNRRQQQLAGDDVVDGKMQHQWIFEQADYPYENSFSDYGGGTGFRFRKMLATDADFTTGSYEKIAGTDWPLIRYAEVLLNFAETAAKTGNNEEAVQVLRDIRKRAGILPGDGNYGLQASQLSGNPLIAAILNERRIELYIENFRLFDLRRWRLYTDDLVPGATTIREGKKLNGLCRHTLKAEILNMPPKNPDHTVLAELDINDEATYFSVFKHTIRAHDSSPIAFAERLYFLRIPYTDHIQVNPVIEQTQGWEDARGAGTFDPYE